jgi:hypothetical protein
LQKAHILFGAGYQSEVSGWILKEIQYRVLTAAEVALE